MYILAEILRFLFSHTLFVSVSLFLCPTSFTSLSITSSFPHCHSPWPLTFFSLSEPSGQCGLTFTSVCLHSVRVTALTAKHAHGWCSSAFMTASDICTCCFFLSWCLSELVFMEARMSAGLSVHMHHIRLWQKSWWFQVRIEWSSPPEVVFLFNSLTASFPRLNRQLNYWWNNSEALLLLLLLLCISSITKLIREPCILMNPPQPLLALELLFGETQLKFNKDKPATVLFKTQRFAFIPSNSSHFVL